MMMRESGYFFSHIRQLYRAELLKSLRNFLNKDGPEHHSIDRMKERRTEKGSVRHSTPCGPWKIAERRGGACMGLSGVLRCRPEQKVNLKVVALLFFLSLFQALFF